MLGIFQIKKLIIQDSKDKTIKEPSQTMPYFVIAQSNGGHNLSSKNFFIIDWWYED